MLDRGAWIASLVLVACAPEPIVVSLELGAHASALILVEGQAELEAYAVDAASTAIMDYPSGSSLRFTALLYERSLADLGLKSGPTKLAGPADPGRPLPTAEEIFERTVADDEATPWQKIDALPPELAGLKLPRPCRALRADWREALRARSRRR